MNLGWWEGRRFHTVRARLEDLSASGALIEVSETPPPSKCVWISLVGLSPVAWVSATVLDGPEVPAKAARFRLSFAETFPYEPFKAAVWGQRGGQHAADPHAAVPSLDPHSPDPEASGTRNGAVTEAQRIRFFLGLGDDRGVGERGTRNDASLISPSPHPPTLVQAHHAQRALHDKVAPISWLVISAVSIVVVLALGIVVITRFRGLRWLAQLPFLAIGPTSLWSQVLAMLENLVAM